MIELLVESGADLNRETSDNKNGFSIACNIKNYSVIEFLLRQSGLNLKKISLADTSIFHDLAHIITDAEGRKVFYIICEKLKDEHELINLVDANGKTPIHHYFETWSTSCESVFSNIHSKKGQEALEEKKKRIAAGAIDTVGDGKKEK